MGAPRKPSIGSPFSSEAGDVSVVILRGWSDTKIREALAGHPDLEGVDVVEVSYSIERWYYCTKVWREIHGIDPVFETYWSSDGDGATSLDVALVARTS